MGYLVSETPGGEARRVPASGTVWICRVPAQDRWDAAWQFLGLPAKARRGGGRRLERAGVRGTAVRAVTATIQARRRPLCRRRPQKRTKGTWPGGAPERRTNLPYDERSSKTARSSRASRAFPSREELEATPGAALAPSECPRLAQPRAPGKALAASAVTGQAQLCGRLRSRRRPDP